MLLNDLLALGVGGEGGCHIARLSFDGERGSEGSILLLALLKSIYVVRPKAIRGRGDCGGNNSEIFEKGIGAS